MHALCGVYIHETRGSDLETNLVKNWTSRFLGTGLAHCAYAAVFVGLIGRWMDSKADTQEHINTAALNTKYKQTNRTLENWKTGNFKIKVALLLPFK